MGKDNWLLCCLDEAEKFLCDRCKKKDHHPPHNKPDHHPPPAKCGLEWSVKSHGDSVQINIQKTFKF